jgi:hypothetical protein
MEPLNLIFECSHCQGKWVGLLYCCLGWNNQMVFDRMGEWLGFKLVSRCSFERTSRKVVDTTINAPR